MKTKTGHKIREDQNDLFSERMLNKLANFCTAHSLMKSDEELRNSFDNFLIPVHTTGDNAEEERLQIDYKGFEELLPVLYELGEVLNAEMEPHRATELPETDFGNHLYASLKRHPE